VFNSMKFEFANYELDLLTYRIFYCLHMLEFALPQYFFCPSPLLGFTSKTLVWVELGCLCPNFLKQFGQKLSCTFQTLFGTVNDVE
jgi:hypothetical protein